MRRVGEAVRTAGGVVVVRAPDEDHPDIGAELLDSNLERIGRVVDIFGPVERPYIAVSPSEGIALPTLLGEKLYTES